MGLRFLGRKAQRLRDLDRVLDRFRQIGELRRHFGRRLEAMLARERAGDPPAKRRCRRRCRAAHHAPRTCRRCRNARHWWRRAGGLSHRPDRSAALPRRALPAGRDAAARHRAGRRTSPSTGRASADAASGWPSTISRLSGPPGPPVSAISPSACARERRGFDMRPVARLGAEIGGAQKLGEIAVADLVLHQQRQIGRRRARHHPGRRGGRLVEIDRQQAPTMGCTPAWRSVSVIS